jgi:hypothetical protein
MPEAGVQGHTLASLPPNILQPIDAAATTRSDLGHHRNTLILLEYFTP